LTNNLIASPDILGLGSSSLLPLKTEQEAELSLTDKISKLIAEIFKNAVNFFGKVTFHSDVNFLGRPTFNKDTAGHATILEGDMAVRVNFEKEYANNPVVMANVNLQDGESIEDVPLYAIYDLTTKGFSIKLSNPAPFNVNFSWNALSVGDQSVAESTHAELDTPETTDKVNSPDDASQSETPEPTDEVNSPDDESQSETLPEPVIQETSPSAPLE